MVFFGGGGGAGSDGGEAVLEESGGGRRPVETEKEAGQESSRLALRQVQALSAICFDAWWPAARGGGVV